MDMVIRHSALLLAGVGFAWGPAPLQLLALTPVVVASGLPIRQSLLLCATYGFGALSPLPGVLLDYSGSVPVALSGTMLVWWINVSVLATALSCPVCWRPVAVMLAVVCLSLPPLAQVSPISPLPVAGLLFPDAGSAGLVLLLALMGVASVGAWRWWAVGGVLTLGAANALASSPTTEETHWAGVWTDRGMPSMEQARAFGLAYRFDELNQADESASSTVVFPESTFGDWQSAYTEIFATSDKRILGGARVYVNDDQYVNVLIDAGSGEIVTTQRQPLWAQLIDAHEPISGRQAGIEAFDVPALMCIELTIPWAVVHSARASERYLVWVANLGWSTNERLAERLNETLGLWARLYGLTPVAAVNTAARNT